MKTWSPALNANRKSRGSACHQELAPDPRSLISSIALFPYSSLGLMAAGYRISSSCWGKALWVVKRLPFLSSLHTCSSCLESICPQHRLDKPPWCISCGSTVLHKWNMAIKESQEFLPAAATNTNSQRSLQFALSTGTKSFFSLVFWKAVNSDYSESNRCLPFNLLSSQHPKKSAS